MAENIKPEILHELLAYNENTGDLFWRERPRKFFTSDGYHLHWNERYAGNEAFTCDNKGHLCGCIFSKKYKAHRVIWAMCTGAWPDNDIDHVNGIRHDNRIENLRDVTSQDNSRNRKLTDLNTSGCVGVVYEKRRNNWYSKIVVDHKVIYLGSFKNIDDAIAARKAAELEYGFHENHGR